MKLLPLFCLLSSWVGPASTQVMRPHDVVTVSEGKDALLPCALGSAQNIETFDWKKDNGDEEKKDVFFYFEGSHSSSSQNEQFKDRVLFFQHELTLGNASIKIKNSRLEDNGSYTCVLFEPRRQEVNIRLNVGAAPLPHINQIPAENGKILLECKAHGVPKPEVQWKDSSGEVLSDTEHDAHVIVHEDDSENFSVELPVTVTRSDTYTCVVTQRDIFHRINNTAKVRIQEEQHSSGALTGWIVAGVLFFLIIAQVIGALCYFARRRKLSGQASGSERKCVNDSSSAPLTSQST